MRHVWGGRGEVHTEFWWGNLKERSFGRSRRGGENHIKIYLKGTGFVSKRRSWRTFINVVVNLRAP
jgi:hypothetical protein